MGEYAKRNDDGIEIKIGTCEDMYYLRYEDRAKVTKIPHSLDPSECDGLRFRLPFPDEDNLAPGEYQEYNRGLRLYKMVPDHMGRKYPVDFTDPTSVDSPGMIQLRHADSGLLLNVPCYHGLKLPEVGPGMTAFWNGKGHSLELSSIKATEGGVFPVVRCRHCGGAWRYTWSDVMDYIEPAMWERLKAYQTAGVAA